ncbi:MAG: hypothetical protein U0133_18665 [Gemmatimonadales bacterium]
MPEELEKNPRGDYSRGHAESVARVMNNQPVQDAAALAEAEARLNAKAATDVARAERSERGQR